MLSLQREFQHLIKLNHQHVIEVHELIVDKQKGSLHLVMEFFPGKELFILLSEIGHYDGQLIRRYSQSFIQTTSSGHSVSAQEWSHSQRFEAEQHSCNEQ